MSTPDLSSEQQTQKYYDAAEVEAYVQDVTNTIKTLQARLREASRRADQAEQIVGDNHPETASLGRALLLAGEVADKTIADADSRAVAIIRAAEDRAAGIISAARAEGDRLVEASRASATEAFQMGEARLLEAVSAFVDGTNVLRAELARIEHEATGWRISGGPPPPPEPARFRLSPPLRTVEDAHHDDSAPSNRWRPPGPPGVHNQASPDRSEGPAPDSQPPVRISSFAPQSDRPSQGVVDDGSTSSP